MEVREGDQTTLVFNDLLYVPSRASLVYRLLRAGPDQPGDRRRAATGAAAALSGERPGPQYLTGCWFSPGQRARIAPSELSLPRLSSLPGAVPADFPVVVRRRSALRRTACRRPTARSGTVDVCRPPAPPGAARPTRSGLCCGTTRSCTRRSAARPGSRATSIETPWARSCPRGSSFAASSRWQPRAGTSRRPGRSKRPKRTLD